MIWASAPLSGGSIESRLLALREPAHCERDLITVMSQENVRCLEIRKRPCTWKKRAAAFFLACFAQVGMVHNTQAAAIVQSDNGADTDPTKPIVFSLREEFYNPEGDPWRNAFILRADKA